MKPGYYIDEEHCLWIVYPDGSCEYHLSESIFAFYWLTGISLKSDKKLFGLKYMGPL